MKESVGEMSIRVTVTGLTHIGCVRRHNEDSIFFSSLGEGGSVLAVVADGMGGHAGGAVASQLAVETFSESWRATDGRVDEPHWLLQTVAQAHRAIVKQARENAALSQMGTTLVAALLRDGALHVAHVGDSRCYCFDGSELVQLTRDHSLVQQMVEQGEMSLEQAARSPVRNYLIRSLGSRANQAELSSRSLQDGDRILLCSDGLTNMLTHSEIASVLAAGATDAETCTSLLDTALARGANDNVSVIVCTACEP